MKDAEKTKQQLLEELIQLRQQTNSLAVAEKEITRQQALDTVLRRLRNTVWNLTNSQDVEQILLGVRAYMVSMDIPFHGCGVNAIDASIEPALIYIHSLRPDGEWIHLDPRPSDSDAIFEMWQNQQIVYRRDLAQEDIYNANDERCDLGLPPVRSIVDVPFSHGTLAVNHQESEAFSAQHIADLKAVAEVLSEGFQRVEDLRNLERSNRELERARDQLEIRVLERTGELQKEIARRKRTEKELRKSEELFRETGALGHIGGWEVDLRTMAPTFTDEVYKLYEIPADEPPSVENGILFYAPEARPIITAAVEKAIGEGIPYDLELPFITAKGNARWVRTIGNVEFTNGKATRLYGIIQDITERKIAEQALRESEAKLDSIIESVPDIIYRLDASGKISFINSAVTAYGYAPEDLVGRHILEITHPEDREKAQSRLNERRNEDMQRDFIEIRMLDKDLKPVPFEFRSNPFENAPASPIDATEKRSLGTLGVARDITERKKLEEATSLSQSLQRVRQVIIQMKQKDDWEHILRILDGELRQWVEYNNCGINITDISAGQWDNYTLFYGELKHIKRSEIAPDLLDAIDTGKPNCRVRAEGWVLWPETEKKSRSVIDVPFYGGTLAANRTEEHAFGPEDIRILESFAQVIAAGVRRLEDLSILAEQEQQLRQAQKMEAVGQLSAGLAHNFNNLLQPIMMTLQLGEMEASERLRPFFEDAKVAAERSRDMVKQMMNLSRGDRSDRADIRPVQLEDVLGETVGICRKTMDRRIEIRTHFNKDIPPVRGNVNQLGQVFLNICLNARDAMQGVERPASIDISLRMEHLANNAETHLPYHLSGDYACVEVKDSGSGMDIETQNRVFEPFFTTKEVGKGTGLGLATVFGIVRQHEGWIECQSDVGVGTTFTVYIPITAETTTPVSPTAIQESTQGIETILVVEDEESIRQVIRYLFEEQGYTILLAEDGQQGLELFEQHRDRINLLLLDLSLPRVSGRELLAQLHELAPDLRVLLMTGLRVDLADYKGALGVVEKPFEIEGLLQVVRDTLDGDARPEGEEV